MHRFYCPEEDFSRRHISITDKEELHHLKDVLRLKKEADVCVFDGRGKEASGKIVSVSSRKADVQILSVNESEQKTPRFILACALPKKSKFEWIIEKATELGVDEIIPLKTKRTEIRLKGDRLLGKKTRYQTIAINAAKQSQRRFIPMIHAVMDFPSALELLTNSTTAIIPSLTGKRRSLPDALKEIKAPKTISFLIGPEGDFTPEEYALAREKGCIPVTLGETTLKVETAAVCALSCASLFLRR